MEVNILLFDDFDTMDAFGPAEVFGSSPQHFHVNYLSVPGNIVNSMQGVVIPGGRGARRLLYQDVESLRLLKKMAERSEICMMIGNGSLLLMQTGSLFRRKIAECKTDENWKRMFTAGVSTVVDASWVAEDENVYQ